MGQPNSRRNQSLLYRGLPHHAEPTTVKDHLGRAAEPVKQDRDGKRRVTIPTNEDVEGREVGLRPRVD